MNVILYVSGQILAEGRAVAKCDYLLIIFRI